MDIIRRDQPAADIGYTRDVDPFRMMRDMLRFDPLRDVGLFDVNFNRMRTYNPRFDVRETREAYLFEADLPGMKENDVTISVIGNRLDVSGRREQQNVQESDNWYTAERTYGQFNRSFMLPDGVDCDNIKADIRDGVLCVTAPKRPEVQPRRIQLGTSTTGTASKNRPQQ